jgi:hypothetical protein
MFPCVVTAGTTASADGARQAVTEAPQSVLGLLFPLLLGDLLQAEAGENPQPEKKQKGCLPGASVAALVPVPVPLPAKPELAVAPIVEQTGNRPSRQETSTSTDLEPAPLGLSASTGEETATTGMPDLGQIAPGDRAAPPNPESAGHSADTSLPAPFALEPIHAELTVPPPASGDWVPAAPPTPTAPTRELSEPSAIGAAQLRPAPQAGSPAAPAVTPASVRDVAATGWISAALSEIATPAPQRSSRAPAVSSPEPAGSKPGLAVAGAPMTPPPESAGSNRGLAVAGPSTRALFGGADSRIQPAGKTDLAFAARLAPLDKQASPHSGVPGQEKFVASREEGTVPSVQPVEMDANMVRRETPGAGSIIPTRTVVHPGADAAPDTDSPVRNTEPLAVADAARVANVPAAASPTPPPHAAVAESHRPAVAAPPEPSVLLSAPAREIRLQLSGGEQRVDVRLTEHRGEVQVAVRTPDSRLTEALRSDLPALSARLEQNGFRAETWHPASSRPEHAGFTPEPSSSGSAPQGDGGERHRNPQDHEAPPRRAPLAEDRPDSPPPEFSWLLSSLR